MNARRAFALHFFDLELDDVSEVVLVETLTLTVADLLDDEPLADLELEPLTTSFWAPSVLNVPLHDGRSPPVLPKPETAKYWKGSSFAFEMVDPAAAELPVTSHSNPVMYLLGISFVFEARRTHISSADESAKGIQPHAQVAGLPLTVAGRLLGILKVCVAAGCTQSLSVEKTWESAPAFERCLR